MTIVVSLNNNANMCCNSTNSNNKTVCNLFVQKMTDLGPVVIRPLLWVRPGFRTCPTEGKGGRGCPHISQLTDQHSANWCRERHTEQHSSNNTHCYENAYLQEQTPVGVNKANVIYRTTAQP